MSYILKCQTKFLVVKNKCHNFAAVSAFVYVNNEENGPTSLLKASEYDEKQVYFNCSCMSDSGLHFRTGHKV